METFLEIFAKHIELSELRIHGFPQIIFLCGGKVGHHADNPSSARAYFFHRIRDSDPELFKRIFLAEAINDWALDMISQQYTPDLLTVESHVSGLASAVSLIVESPGSIAELGSFCLLPDVQRKLMVVLRDEWATTNSFISRGPVKYLQNLNSSETSAGSNQSIYTYSWGLDWDHDGKTFLPNTADLSQNATDYIKDLLEFESNLAKRPKFRHKALGHVSLLIADVLNIFSILNITEIVRFLALIKFKEMKAKDVKAHLFLLEKLKLITTRASGSAQYYIGVSDDTFIEYNLQSAPHYVIDRIRFKTRILQHIKGTDPRRFRTLTSALKTFHDSTNDVA